MRDLIRDRFIHKVLKQEGDKFFRGQTKQIESKLKRQTGNLLANRRIMIYGSNGDFDAMLVLQHPTYERFLDMYKLANQEKQTRRYIHNRLVMRMYNNVADRLMTEFTDEMKAQIKAEFEQIRQRIVQYGQ